MLVIGSIFSSAGFRFVVFPVLYVFELSVSL
jgi:hypothetical protein